MTIFVISDTHFGHSNILKFKTTDGEPLRLFESVEHMNETMVENWNRVVADDDIVYHLGDVYFGQGHEVLSRLKGRKRLILGNHDNAKSPEILNNFQKILMWRMFPEYNCLLTHVPVHASSLYKTKYNLHGHVHKNSVPESIYINCCVEMLNFTPTPIEDLVPKEIETC